MSGQTGSQVRRGKAAAGLAARTLRPSSIIPREDTLPDAPAVIESMEGASAMESEPIVSAPEGGIGSRRERLLTPVPPSSIPLSKRPRRRLSRGEDDDVEIIVSPSTADAYMRQSVPVFVENSAVRTPGPAPRMHAASPREDLAVVDDVYRRPSPGLERPQAAESDEQRVITLTDSGLLQLFRAHGLDLDRKGTFCCDIFLLCETYRPLARFAYIGWFGRPQARTSALPPLDLNWIYSCSVHVCASCGRHWFMYALLVCVFTRVLGVSSSSFVAAVLCAAFLFFMSQRRCLRRMVLRFSFAVWHLCGPGFLPLAFLLSFVG